MVGWSIPVQRGHDSILGERCRVRFVHSPNGETPLLHIIVWDIVGIVEGSDYEDQPGENREELVGPNSLDWMGLASREWVDC